MPVRYDIPHLRSRPRRRRPADGWSTTQQERFEQERCLQLLDELEERMHAVTRFAGQAGSLDIERLAVRVRDAVEAREREDGPGTCRSCREEIAAGRSVSCGCSRSSSWGGDHAESWSRKE
jgi:hypothetical protein